MKEVVPCYSTIGKDLNFRAMLHKMSIPLMI